MLEFSWRSANEATREDVEAVFDAGGARRCRCQALKVAGWIWRDTTQEERDAALLAQATHAFEGPGEQDVKVVITLEDESGATTR